MGVVLVIDATKPETLPRARYFIEMIEKKKIPFVVAAGKIRQELGINKKIPVYPIAATVRTDVHHVLESLVDYITQYQF